jgi:FkbM family methyltransferase
MGHTQRLETASPKRARAKRAIKAQAFSLRAARVRRGFRSAKLPRIRITLWQRMLSSTISSMDRVPNDLLDGGGINRLVRGRDGWFVYNRFDEYIGRSIEHYGEYNWFEAQLLLQLLRPDDVVIEVGANIGSHTVGLAKAVGPRGQVYAFEPQRVVFQLLCANVALNSLLWAHCVQAAVGLTQGQVSVPVVEYTRAGNFGGVPMLPPQAGGETVPLLTLDSCMKLDRLRLLKIDVEGMEQAVIEGARGLITRYRPFLYVENDRPDRSAALIDTIQSLGYRCYWHLPYLFNPNNWFQATQNLFPGTVSLNMLCIPASVDADVSGLRLVDDLRYHPTQEFGGTDKP